MDSHHPAESLPANLNFSANHGNHATALPTHAMTEKEAAVPPAYPMVEKNAASPHPAGLLKTDEHRAHYIRAAESQRRWHRTAIRVHVFCAFSAALNLLKDYYTDKLDTSTALFGASLAAHISGIALRALMLEMGGQERIDAREERADLWVILWSLVGPLLQIAGAGVNLGWTWIPLIAVVWAVVVALLVAIIILAQRIARR